MEMLSPADPASIRRLTVCATFSEWAVLALKPIPAENLLPAWHPFTLHPQLYAALYSQKFVSPTPIQSQAIPKAFSGRDVIGVAETVC
jgi:superfamily II DNA/RNA helicase